MFNIRRALCFLIFSIPCLAYSQTDSSNYGIKWVTGLSWEQVKRKAEKENKPIFMDCFATWCGPCKKMEKDVFTNEEVGSFINSHYIPVRVQMDKTKSDDANVKSWYVTANSINDQYGIDGYPTFFYFDPKGELIHRVSGYMNKEDILRTSKDVIDPAFSKRGLYVTYYKLISQFQKGKRDYAVMASLADTAKFLAQGKIADTIAKVYREYLLREDQKKWFTTVNLSFILNFVSGSSDIFFNILYFKGEIVDSILQQKGRSKLIVDRIIQREDIEPVTKPFKGLRRSDYVPGEVQEPDWQRLSKTISEKYNADISLRNVLYARTQWYIDNHMWEQSALCFLKYIKKCPAGYIDDDLIGFINSVGWNVVFKRSVDKELIDASINYFGSFLSTFKKQYGYVITDLWDTYANILHKAGQTQKAILVEEEAILNDQMGDKELTEALKRMRQGKPTWPRYIDRHDFFGKGLVD